MKKLLILLAIFTSIAATAQSVGINADGSVANTTAILDVSSTTKGLVFAAKNDHYRARPYSVASYRFGTI